jgi:hypothetical protein
MRAQGVRWTSVESGTMEPTPHEISTMSHHASEDVASEVKDRAAQPIARGGTRRVEASIKHGVDTRG